MTKKLAPPKHLNKEEKKIWLEVVGLIDTPSSVDIHFASVYAMHYVQYLKLSEDLELNGSTYIDDKGVQRRRPEVLERSKAFDTFTKAAQTLAVDRKTRASTLGKKAGKAAPSDRLGNLIPMKKVN